MLIKNLVFPVGLKIVKLVQILVNAMNVLMDINLVIMHIFVINAL